MKNLEIYIDHYIPGRIRLRLIKPPRNINDFYARIKEHDGIVDIKFNPLTKSLLVHYKPAIISSIEIVVRASILLSLDYRNKPVIIKNMNEKTKLTNFDYYAAISVLASLAASLVSGNTNFAKYLKYNGTFSTLIAVILHAVNEVKKDGVYDPEVISAVYLINSILKGNFIIPSILTWSVSFGRHLLTLPEEITQIEATTVKEEDDKEYVEVVARACSQNKIDKNPFNMLVIVLARLIGINLQDQNTRVMSQIEQMSKKHGNVLEGIGEKCDVVYLRL